MFLGADIQFRRSDRLDVCVSLNHPIALCVSSLFAASHIITLRHRVFLPASDIPSFVGKGDVDLGITGHDVVLESQMDGVVTEVLRLGFGKCALQVQVPESGPIQSLEALAGKRVVSSFKHLSGEYFSRIDDQEQLVGDARTRIQYVGGSVEAACALGLADGIGTCMLIFFVRRIKEHLPKFSRSRWCVSITVQRIHLSDIVLFRIRGYNASGGTAPNSDHPFYRSCSYQIQPSETPPPHVSC